MASPPDEPLTVKLNPIAYLKFALHGTQYPVEQEDMPDVSHALAYGFLLGTFTPGAVNVKDYVPLFHHEGHDFSFEENPLLFNQIAEINREELEVYESENCVVGWAHSHGGRGIRFTPTDALNHVYFQKEFLPGSIAIVFDPKALEEDYGFEVYHFAEDTAIVTEFSLPATAAWEFTNIEDPGLVFTYIHQICAKYRAGEAIVTEWSAEPEETEEA